MYATSIESGEAKQLRGGRGLSHQLLNPDVGCPHLVMQVNVLQPGSGPGPYHYHSNADNIYLVLSGRGWVTVDGQSREVQAGDALYVAPGERHDLQNIGDDDLEVVEIKVPADSDFIIVEEERPAGDADA